MTNSELFEFYDSDLVLRLHNTKNLGDTRKILAKFKQCLNSFPPSPELARGIPDAVRRQKTADALPLHPND